MSETPPATDPASGDDEYIPLQLPVPPQDEAARRAHREAREESETQREILLDRLAAAYADLDAAEEANDAAAITNAQGRIAKLQAEKNRV